MFGWLNFWKKNHAAPSPTAPAESVPAAESMTIIVAVAIDHAELPVEDRVRANYAELFPDAPALGRSFGDGTKLVLAMDEGAMGAIIMLPAPIPWGDLEGPCSWAYWWPEAAESMKRHGAHLILTIIGNRGTAVQQHLRMTRFTAAVAGSVPSVGIYWNSTLVHSPEAFRSLARSMTEHEYAPHLWIDMRVVNATNDVSYFATAGLPAFGLEDLEIDAHGDSPPLADFGLAIVMYLLKRGHPIKDGETVGRTAEEKLPVAHGPSRHGFGTVMKIAL